MTASSKLPTTAKPDGGESGRHLVEQIEEPLRDSAIRRSFTARAGLAAAEGPETARQLGHAVEHGACGAEPQARQQHEPEEHAEHVTVRGEQRLLDEVAQKFAGRQLACIEMTPLAEQAPRLDLVATVERIANVGEVVAELPKAEASGRARRHVEGEAQ